MTAAINADTVLPIVLTQAAVRQVKGLIAEEKNDALMLRIYVEGGGCSGFQYGFAFEEAAGEDDVRVETDGLTLLVDPLSVQYLSGVEIDFEENLEGSRFVVRNPNAKRSCGCGNSFSCG